MMGGTGAVQQRQARLKAHLFLVYQLTLVSLQLRGLSGDGVCTTCKSHLTNKRKLTSGQ